MYPQEDAVSRHEIARIVDEMRGKYLMPAPVIELPPRRQATLMAATRAAVLLDRFAWSDIAAVLPYWDGNGAPPSRTQLRGLAALVKETVPTIRDLDAKVAPWTGGFWLGLRLSGAITEWSGRLELAPRRPWLESDLEHMSIPGGLRPPNKRRARSLIGCLAARLPPASELGADVLAGLLTGARRHEAEDGVWLTFPRNDRTLRLLDYYGISVVEGRLPSRRGLVRMGLWISPFYGHLVNHLMPPTTGESMVLIRHAGGCPVLPLAYWQVLHGAGDASQRYCNPPRAGLLPYLVSHSTRRRLGYSREFLYQASVRLGIAHVPLEMRQLINDWRNRVPSESTGPTIFP